jgi:subtilisin family serine protease
LLGASIQKFGKELARLLLIGVLTVAINNACFAISGGGPTPTSTPPSSSSNNTGLYVLGGLVVVIIGAIVVNTIFANPPQPTTPPSGSPPPGPAPDRILVDPPPPPPPPVTLSGPPLRRGFHQPPRGETRFVINEVILEIGSGVSPGALDAIAARLGLTRLEGVRIRLLGRTLYRLRIVSSTAVADMIRLLSRETPIVGAQPNYLYELSQEGNLNSNQYAPTRLNVPGAHRFATGHAVLVAVIDSPVDVRHPDLEGAVVANFNAAGDDSPPHLHGTGMAGAIAARHNMLSIAPRVRLLTVHAFSTKTPTVEGTTFNILKGLDWAADQGARIVNMSFAGPADPRLQEALQKAVNKGMVLIAAAGNAGPSSPPLYPAADPNVIAVAATDINDRLFARSVRGNHIAVAAPGVEILVPAPDGSYQFSTGTSVAAAEVSGVAALLIERNPKLTAKDIRAILMRTARDLGPKGKDRETGAGLVDALQAVTAVAGAR